MTREGSVMAKEGGRGRGSMGQGKQRVWKKLGGRELSVRG